jgi:ketosteroid isomerase-like protein
VSGGLVRLTLLSPSALLAYTIVFLVAAYYLGVRRSTVNVPRRNGRLESFLKVLLLVCLSCVAIGALVATAAKPSYHGSAISLAYAPSITQAKDSPDTLRQLEGEFMKAAAERGSQGYLSYYADDAVEVPNGAPIIQGRVNIAKTMGFLDDKNNQLTWVPVGADISASGDLGYTYGTYEFRSRDKDSKVVVDHGKYTSIWKKQKDGSWKVVLDMGNSGQ